MGGWRILAVYLFAGLVYIVVGLSRHRFLPVQGSGALSFHLGGMALLLADAAVFPEGVSSLGAPLGLGAVVAVVLFLRRESWLLLGPGGERALDLLEESCAQNGIATVRDRGRLVLKRHGAAAERKHLLPGLEIVRFDLRRNEPAVFEVQRAWRVRIREAGRRDRE